ncbi:unnamed protein product [Soboliphyme baturini]|uniref:Solute carrier family 12 member 9 n=1 Tax=Soboliphyme baturini TaxID=241478 RepID=A0A183J2Y7_9BILA|nr:unnamed protein product [Soboliphyme baturini]
MSSSSFHRSSSAAVVQLRPPLAEDDEQVLNAEFSRSASDPKQPSWRLVTPATTEACVLLIGAYNVIAQITSIFFLLSYAGVNIACLALDLTSAPNFRPNFKYFSVHTSFLGFIGCIAMMFFINSVSSGIAIILLLLLLIGLHYGAPMPASWGSISQALIFHQVRKYLLMLDSRKEHVKFWRPQILLLVANPKSCLPLIDFVNDLKKSGLYVLGHVKVISDSGLNRPIDPVQEDMPYWLGLIDYLKIKAFVEITVAASIRDGIQHLVRLSGIGAMKPNTVMLGFYDSTPHLNTFEKGKLLRNIKFAKLERAEVVEYFTAQDFDPDSATKRLTVHEYVSIIKDIIKMNKNIGLAKGFHRLDKEVLLKSSGYKCVDVWPVDLVRPENASTSWDNSSLFLLQLACILSMVSRWKTRIMLRVFLCVTSLQDMHHKEVQLKEMLSQLRIRAKSILLPWDHADSQQLLPSFNELLKRNSSQSAVVFLNLPLPPENIESAGSYVERLDLITADLPPSLMVYGISSVISTAL